MALEQWAVPQLSKLLPLDEESLKEIVIYSASLPKADAAEHLKNLLGDSAQALEFIASFNQRRQASTGNSATSSAVRTDEPPEAVPRVAPRSQRKKPAFNKLPAPRQIEDYGNVQGGYKKKDLDDYMATSSKPKKPDALAGKLALESEPEAKQLPTPDQGMTPAVKEQKQSKLPPSAAGALISDSKPSRSSSPAAKAKVNVTGGTSMRGASATLNDLDSAIRALELQTNPTLSSDDTAKRRCNCMAQRHPLLTAAPNCMACGKIICAKEGLGPCTFCGTPLLSNAEIQAMVKVLKEERGRERQESNNAVHRRAEVSKAPRPFANSSPASSNLSTPGHVTPVGAASGSDSESETLARAKQHRDRLLKFQAENARRTRIHDEAADFETPDAGTNMWASPQERALQLKRQQAVLREQQWNARPEYERRQMVVSIDVKSGKAIRRFAEVERQKEPDSEPEDVEFDQPASGTTSGGGAFSKNPLLGSLIRPVWKPDEGDKGKAVAAEEKKQRWRRVQDDNDDNEKWILDGGAYGDKTDTRVLGAEEHGCG